MNVSINKPATTTHFFVVAITIALALNALATFSTVSAANGESIQPIRVKACALSPVTWARDDHLPPMIRSAPPFDMPIVGRMTHTHSLGEYGFRGSDISVTAISGDWASVDAVKAELEYGLAASPTGWIEQDDIYFVMQTSAGFSRLDEKSRQVYASDDWIYRKANLGIRDCRGGLLKLTINGHSEEREGQKPSIITAWFRGICGVEETTCDRVDYK